MTTERNKTMSGDVIMEKIIKGEIRSFGFRFAYFPDIPESEPMELGWFDLSDGDHQPLMEDGVLFLEMWFRQLFPENAVLEVKEVDSPYGLQRMQKVRVAVASVDVQYVHIDGYRYWTDWAVLLLDDPGANQKKKDLEEWEAAWNTYIAKLNRVDELKAAGRYGYQLRMPYKAVALAAQKLRELDSEFCNRMGIY